MKLSECTIGTIVIEKFMGRYGRIEHIVDLEYNVRLSLTGNSTAKELRDRTIPIVAFPDGKQGIYQGNLELYRDKDYE